MAATSSAITVVPATLEGFSSPVPVLVAITDSEGSAVTAYTAYNGSTEHDDPARVEASTTFWFVGEIGSGPYTVTCTTDAGQVFTYRRRTGPVWGPALVNVDKPLLPDTAAIADDPDFASQYGLVVTVAGVGDGTTDNAAAIDAAIALADALVADGKTPTLVFPESEAGFATSGNHEALNMHVVMRSPLVHTGTGVALTVGADTGSNKAYALSLDLSVEREPDWTTGNIGVRLQNCYSCDIVLRRVSGFAIGVQAFGHTVGFVYNIVRVLEVFDNACQIELSNASSGWCSQNTWLGGHLYVQSFTNASTARTGVRITSSDASYLVNNNNVFYNTSIELTGSNNGLPIDIVHGERNTWKDLRLESNRTDYMAVISNASRDNVIEIGYATSGTATAVSEAGTYASTFVRQGLVRGSWQPSYARPLETGDVVRLAHGTDGSGAVGVAGLVAMSSGASTPLLGASSITIGADYVEIPSSRALGVYVDTTSVKTFRVTTKTPTDYKGRPFVQCYNSAGTILTNVDAGHPYAKANNASLAWNSSFGGRYMPGSDTNGYTFTVGADVAYVFVGFHGWSAACRLQAALVEALTPGLAASWTHRKTQHGTLAKYSTAIPTAGTYEVGDVIWNASAAAGGAPGWVCTTAGSPGTWKAMANLAA